MNKLRGILFPIIFLLIMGYQVYADEIHNAAKAGDIDKLKELLEKNATLVKSTDENDQTPLHHAIAANALEAATLLIEHGADVNAPDSQKRAPLHTAAYEGNAAAVKLLLSRGADYTLRELRQRIPLALACGWGRDVETVRLLIDAGSDVNDSNPNDGVMIVALIPSGQKEIIELLLDRGAVIPDDENSLRRVLWTSSATGMERPFFIALEKIKKTEIKWWEGMNLDACARGGSVEIGKLLVAQGAEVNVKNPWGIEPLHVAAENGKTEFVELLLTNGAVIDSPCRTGKTALHFAQENGHEDTAALLIAKGASTEPPKFPQLKGPYLGQPAPGKKLEPFAMGIVSSHGFSNEHSPAVFSPDGTEVFWTKQYRGPVLYMKQENGVWTAPRSAPFCTEWGEGEPIFSPDGKKLFFLSRRPLEEGGPTEKENIWYVEKIEGGWSEPQPVSQRINANNIYWLFSIANDGTLYFPTTRKDGYGAQDIYYSRYENGEYQEPENLGAVINSPGFQRMPLIAPDESYLLFISSGDEPSTRTLKLYISFRAEDGSWMTPVDLGEKHESLGRALCPVITPDGKYMFCLSRGDIYWTDAGFIEELRPKEQE